MRNRANRTPTAAPKNPDPPAQSVPPRKAGRQAQPAAKSQDPKSQAPPCKKRDPTKPPALQYTNPLVTGPVKGADSARSHSPEAVRFSTQEELELGRVADRSTPGGKKNKKSASYLAPPELHAIWNKEPWPTAPGAAASSDTPAPVRPTRQARTAPLANRQSLAERRTARKRTRSPHPGSRAPSDGGMEDEELEQALLDARRLVRELERRVSRSRSRSLASEQEPFHSPCATPPLPLPPLHLCTGNPVVKGVNGCPMTTSRGICDWSAAFASRLTMPLSGTQGDRENCAAAEACGQTKVRVAILPSPTGDVSGRLRGRPCVGS